MSRDVTFGGRICGVSVVFLFPIPEKVCAGFVGEELCIGRMPFFFSSSKRCMVFVRGENVV